MVFRRRYKKRIVKRRYKKRGMYRKKIMRRYKKTSYDGVYYAKVHQRIEVIPASDNEDS